MGSSFVLALAVSAAVGVTALAGVRVQSQAAAKPAQKYGTLAVAGKYRIELRIPEGGLYAGEELDVEFRVTDTTQKDPVEEGFKGVGAISASGVVTMPTMPGMPKQVPSIHREGVPGDYGIVVYFPHGGDYQIDLMLKIPGEAPVPVSFTVDVADQRPSGLGAKPPYAMKIVDWPKTATAGKPSMLKMRIVETKTGRIETKFDVAHEMRFHLLLASQDLGWFAHEHPKMEADGTWSLPVTFPAGGRYFVYGDVAPSGKGSRILMGEVKVAGKAPTWPKALKLASTGKDGALKGQIRPVGGAFTAGKMSTVEIRLTDTRTGKPAGDTIPWLGAAGHLMIIREGGKTIVHSHPEETAASHALVKKGIVRFNARFPQSGRYKAYAQLQWMGKIKTIPFGIDVK